MLSNKTSFVHFPKPDKAYNISITPYKDSLNEIYLKIKWNINASDLKTWLYQSRINLPDSTLLLAIDSPLTDTEFDFYAGNSGNDTYAFSLVTTNTQGERSGFYDTIVFTVPNYEYGRVFFNAVEVNNNIVDVYWKFPEYKDIKGFRIFNNGNLLLYEDQVDGTLRTLQLNDLPSGKNELSIQAVSIYGVESKMSPVKKVNLP